MNEFSKIFLSQAIVPLQTTSFINQKNSSNIVYFLSVFLLSNKESHLFTYLFEEPKEWNNIRPGTLKTVLGRQSTQTKYKPNNTNQLTTTIWWTLIFPRYGFYTQSVIFFFSLQICSFISCACQIGTKPPFLFPQEKGRKIKNVSLVTKRGAKI